MNDLPHESRADGQTPRVSVVIPSLNGARFIAQSLESVRSQTFKPLETIVVDGGSTDGTAEIARSFEGVRFIRQSGRGISGAYNTGIAEARGELIAFNACDDFWTLDKLAIQVDHLLRNPHVEFATAHVRYFVEPGLPTPANLRPELLRGPQPGRIMETLLARRSVFERVGGLNEAFAIAMDVDWYSRCGDAGVSMTMLPDVLLHRRVHGSNNSMNTAGNNREILAAMRRSLERKRSNNSAAMP